MPKLKNSIINKILNRLEMFEFCKEDFLVDFPDSDTLVKITFNAMPKYSFIIDETTSGGSLATIGALSNGIKLKKKIRSIEKPGSYKNIESNTHDDIDDAIDRIYPWTENLREDIIHSKNSIRDTLDELNDELLKNIDENLEDPESFFEQDEIEKLKNKLDELKNRVESLEKKHGISSDDVEKLETAIDKSKKDLDLYPKAVWYKTSGNKILKTMKAILKSKEGRSLLVDMVKKLIS